MKLILPIPWRSCRPLYAPTLAMLSLLWLTAAGSEKSFAAKGASTIAASAAADCGAVQTTLPSPSLYEFASLKQWFGSRSRMVQVGFVVLAIGVGLLMWGKSR